MPESITPVRVCRNCGNEKPLSHFANCARRLDGKNPWCLLCTRRRNVPHPKTTYCLPGETPASPEYIKRRLMASVVVNSETGCWEWQRFLAPTGYGAILVAGRFSRVHRASYEVHIGPIPDGLLVLHRCDNRACINPAHLFLGTQKDNLQDASAKGRIAYGERSGTSKLTAAQVEVIRERLARGERLYIIARDYPVNAEAIREIKSGKSWRR